MSKNGNTEIEKAVEKVLSEFEFDIPQEDIDAAVKERIGELAEKAKLIDKQAGDNAKLNAETRKVLETIANELAELKANKPKEIHIKKDGKTIKLKGVVHEAFDRVMKWVTSRDKNGYPIPVWLYGGAGGGKSHLAAQVASALGIDFYPIYLSPTTSDSKIVGFKNAGVGAYVVGLAYDAYCNGGLLYFDEIDVAEPGCLVAINSLVANTEYRFPDGKVVKRHVDFYCLAGANTLGTGSIGGYRRQNQDAAVRNRWAKVRLDYDLEMEMKLSQHQQWTKYVQKVRHCLAKMAKHNIVISPRDSYIGSAALENGVPAEEVVEHLFAEMTQDVRHSVIEECGVFNPK